jgi:lipopolysaccharide transport system ATP-binding protein
MYMRLAFAVAAHLEPEVLVVDEVLAVGDAEFQKKCLGKMNDVAKSGRTVLFVSHNMGAIQALCLQAILLEKGIIISRGDVSTVVNKYAQSGYSDEGQLILTNNTQRVGTGNVRFQAITTQDAEQHIRSEFLMGESLIIDLEIQASTLIEECLMSVDIKTITGVPVLHLFSADHSNFRLRSLNGNRHVQVEIPNLPLYPGTYTFSFWIGDKWHWYDYLADCMTVHVTEGSLVGRSGLGWDKAIFFYPVHWRDIPPMQPPILEKEIREEK